LTDRPIYRDKPPLVRAIPCAAAPAASGNSFASARDKSQRLGEVTSLTRNDAVIFLVLNASTATYPKLKDEYAAFVKSLAGPAPPPPPKPPAVGSPI
jgi:hypothetical protein